MAAHRNAVAVDTTITRRTVYQYNLGDGDVLGLQLAANDCCRSGRDIQAESLRELYDGSAIPRRRKTGDSCAVHDRHLDDRDREANGHAKMTAAQCGWAQSDRDSFEGNAQGERDLDTNGSFIDHAGVLHLDLEWQLQHGLVERLLNYLGLHFTLLSVRDHDRDAARQAVLLFLVRPARAEAP